MISVPFSGFDIAGALLLKMLYFIDYLLFSEIIIITYWLNKQSQSQISVQKNEHTILLLISSYLL